jgi:hypothetical protein
MVPAEGIEPPTFGLQNRCSTAELSRPIDDGIQVSSPRLMQKARGEARRQITDLSGEGKAVGERPGPFRGVGCFGPQWYR